MSSENSENLEESCKSGISRSQFISKVIEKAGATGLLLLAPAIVESFVAPPPAAANSAAPGLADTPTGTLVEVD